MSTWSRYGSKFDRLAGRWAVVENEHELHHPDLNDCGEGPGARCSMLEAAHKLHAEAVEALEEWRRNLPGYGGD